MKDYDLTTVTLFCDNRAILFHLLIGLLTKKNMSRIDIEDVKKQLLLVNNLALEGKPHDSVADYVFAKENVDALLLEYDDERSGGFTSCEIGNKLTEEEQWEKLKLVKEIAEEVWG